MRPSVPLEKLRSKTATQKGDPSGEVHPTACGTSRRRQKGNREATSAAWPPAGLGSPWTTSAVRRGGNRSAGAILTTEKDAVRFPKLDRRDLPILFMRVEIKIVSGADDFRDCVRKICFR